MNQWQILQTLGPTWSFWLAFIFVAGVVTALNIYDIRLRGMFNRPDGYLSWWVIPLFDWVGAPFLAACAAAFAQATSNYPTQNAGQAFWSAASVVTATVVTVAWIATANGEDWTKEKGVGLVSNLKSLNWYGRYHLLVFFVVANLVTAALLQGFLYMREINEPHITRGYVWLWLIFLGTFGIAQIPDYFIRAWGAKITPNHLLSRLFGEQINF